MADLVGQVVGNYIIEERIGTGGMGQVYRGTHRHLNRDGAVKVMHGYAAVETDFQERFRREARAAAALEHPNIVATHDFGEQDEQLFLVMELLLDGSIRDLIRRQRDAAQIDLREGVDLMRQVAEGLAYAHRRGMIHRDIKPENLLLKRNDDESARYPYTVKIADFGLARLIEGNTMTLTGAIMGTPAYMSPEQCQGFDLDARSDIYSLGVVMFELLTSQRPFESKSPTEAAFKHAYIPPPSPRDIHPDFDEELSNIILRSLAKSPSERFATTNDLVLALRAVQARFDPVVFAPHATPPSIDQTSFSLPPSLPEIPRSVEPPVNHGGNTPTIEHRTPTLAFATVLEPDPIVVTPGEPIVARATVVNHLNTPLQLALAFTGIPAAWVEMSTPSLDLGPLASAVVGLRIVVPASASYAPGDYPVTLNVRSLAHPGAAMTTRTFIELLPAASPPPTQALTIAPITTRGPRVGEFAMQLQNIEGVPEVFALRVASNDADLKYELAQDTVRLEPGETCRIAVAVQAPPFRLGGLRQHPFQVLAEGQGSGVRHSAASTFVQTGMLPLWAPLIGAATLLIAVLLAASSLFGAEGQAKGAPEIESVSVSPTSPRAGEPVTVSWTVSGAESIDIRPLVTGLDPEAGSHTFDGGIGNGNGGPLVLVAINADGSSEESLSSLLIAPEETETATATATTVVGGTPATGPAATATVPATASATATVTAAATATQTRTPTPTATATSTATATATATETPTPTPTPTNTPVPPTPTFTPVPPTPTFTPVPPTPTFTPVPPTPTFTPVPPTPTNTPIPTPPPVG